MEVTSAGSLKVTTVFNQESRPASFKAVYNATRLSEDVDPGV